MGKNQGSRGKKLAAKRKRRADRAKRALTSIFHPAVERSEGVVNS